MLPKRVAAVLSTLLLLTTVPVALAQDEDEQPYEKSVDTRDHKVTIEVTQTTPEREDTLAYTFDTNNATLVVGAITKVPPGGDDDEPPAPQMRVEAQLHQLLEYDDADEDGRYTSNDTIVANWNVSEGSEPQTEASPNGTLQWQPLEEENITSDDGVTGWHIQGTARYPLEVDDPLSQGASTLLEDRERGNFTVHLYTFSHPAEFHGRTLFPTDVLVTIGTEDYPYQENGTKTAVVFETQGTDGVDQGATGEISAEGEILGLDTELSTTWENEAVVDGDPAPVRTDLLDPEAAADGDEGSGSTATRTNAVLVHSYPRAEQTLSHPHVQSAQFGSDSNLRDKVDETPAPGAAAAALAAGLVALAARRSRRSR